MKQNGSYTAKFETFTAAPRSEAETDMKNQCRTFSRLLRTIDSWSTAAGIQLQNDPNVIEVPSAEPSVTKATLAARVSEEPLL